MVSKKVNSIWNKEALAPFQDFSYEKGRKAAANQHAKSAIEQYILGNRHYRYILHLNGLLTEHIPPKLFNQIDLASSLYSRVNHFKQLWDLRPSSNSPQRFYIYLQILHTIRDMKCPDIARKLIIIIGNCTRNLLYDWQVYMSALQTILHEVYQFCIEYIDKRDYIPSICLQKKKINKLVIKIFLQNPSVS